MVPGERRSRRRSRRSCSGRASSSGRSSGRSSTPSSSTTATACTAGSIVAAPGHADGQLTLLKDGVLIAADHLLARITPTVGLWPASRPDPLGDYLGSLQRTIDLAPAIAYGGHGDTVTDPVGRANELTRPSRRAAARHRGRDRHRAAHGLRGVVPAVRRRSAAGGAPVCRRRDALPSRAARPGRRGRTPRAAAERGRRQRLLYCRAVVGELPSSTAAPETGA